MKIKFIKNKEVKEILLDIYQERIRLMSAIIEVQNEFIAKPEIPYDSENISLLFSNMNRLITCLDQTEEIDEAPEQRTEKRRALVKIIDQQQKMLDTQQRLIDSPQETNRKLLKTKRK